jgi:hypothetical protein
VNDQLVYYTLVIVPYLMSQIKEMLLKCYFHLLESLSGPDKKKIMSAQVTLHLGRRYPKGYAFRREDFIHLDGEIRKVFHFFANL